MGFFVFGGKIFFGIFLLFVLVALGFRGSTSIPRPSSEKV